MGLHTKIEPCLLWDNLYNQMVVKRSVTVQMISNKGNVIAEEGPLYCLTGSDIFHAIESLKRRLVGHLVPLEYSSKITNTEDPYGDYV